MYGKARTGIVCGSYRASFYHQILPPVIICQGTDDWRVVPEQAYAMDKALTAAGKEHKLVIYPGADHSLKGTTFVDDIMAWFQAHPL